MAITINTNMGSLTAQASLSRATNRMNTAMERLSTGLRINSSKDDAAGAAVVTKLDYKVNSLNVAVDNAQMGSSLLDTAEGTLNVVQSNLERIRELTEQAANGTYGVDAMDAIKSEIQGRLDEMDRIAASTEFNGKYLLNGSMDQGINLQVGIMADDNSVIKLEGSLFAPTTAKDLLGEYDLSHEVTTAKATIDGTPDTVVIKDGDQYFKANITADGVAEIDGNALTGADEEAAAAAIAASDETAKVLDTKFVNGDAEITAVQDADGNIMAKDNLDGIFSTDRYAQKFLENVDKALSDVTARKTEIGAYQQRLSSAMEVSNVMATNLTAASSLIKDADIAKESSDYIKNQILQQATTSLLATANQNPNIALNLL